MEGDRTVLPWDDIFTDYVSTRTGRRTYKSVTSRWQRLSRQQQEGWDGFAKQFDQGLAVALHSGCSIKELHAFLKELADDENTPRRLKLYRNMVLADERQANLTEKYETATVDVGVLEP